MENNQPKTESNYSIMYLLAVLTGIATAWVVTASFLWMFIGTVLGLLSAGLFISKMMKDGEKA
ncbi:MAG: hypothetical protein WBP45_13370 [Daejeonella sp.]